MEKITRKVPNKSVDNTKNEVYTDIINKTDTNLNDVIIDSENNIIDNEETQQTEMGEDAQQSLETETTSDENIINKEILSDLTEDVVTKQYQRPKRKKAKKEKKSIAKLFRFLFLVAVIVVVSFGIIKLFGFVGSIISSRPQDISTKSQEITITSTGSLDYQNFQKGVLVANSGTITYYNSKMESAWEVPGFAGLPVIHTNGRYALVAYTNTSNAMLITGSDSIPVTGSGKIVSSYVNKNGYFALVMTEDGYKNQIAVFDNYCNLIYKWHSAENYITCVAISPDNKTMSAATVGFTENGFDSGIMMFDLAQNNPCSGKHQSDNLIMDIQFVSNSKLVAIGDKSTTFYKKDGKAVKTIDYEGKKLITFDVAESGKTILCFARDDSSMSSCDIYSYKLSGRQTGHFETDGKVLSVATCAGKVLVAKDGEFNLLSDSCRKIRTTSIVRDLNNSVLFNEGKYAFVISGNLAQIVKVG